MKTRKQIYKLCFFGFSGLALALAAMHIVSVYSCCNGVWSSGSVGTLIGILVIVPLFGLLMAHILVRYVGPKMFRNYDPEKAKDWYRV